ncbi:PREDICTED: centrosome-associated protein 350-like [Acropora digitifera]|uniref:centrosome-associated protein 350-like n=1 Tax=Acropora digitifera TaxID=70779 RepID=UPI00077A8116|nr:PREDICTED: centrosome-associated protein 350-like [Acropora digitifera]
MACFTTESPESQQHSGSQIIRICMDIYLKIDKTVKMYKNKLLKYTYVIKSCVFVVDSLEVGVPRSTWSEPVLTTALGPRPATVNSSDALARLKERIKQQKEQASRASSAASLPRNTSPSVVSPPIEASCEVRAKDSNRPVEDVPVRTGISKRKVASAPAAPACGNTSPSVVSPPIEASCEVRAKDSTRPVEDVPVRTGISKRKVASAPAAPAYKGFSEVESKTSASSVVNKRLKSRGPSPMDLRSNQRSQKPPPKKAPKLQRVVAPRRPTDAITTSSWRTGQQTVKRILGPSKKTKTSPENSRPHSRNSQDTDISESNSSNFHWKGEDEGRKSSSLDDGESSGKAGSTKDTVSRKVSTEHQEHKNGTKKDSDNDTEPSHEHYDKAAVSNASGFLQELYNKQKKNLQNNLHRKEKKTFGETYSKGHSEFKSIYLHNHPFAQDEEEEHYSDVTGVSESDKENFDIASFRGLPSYPAANGHDGLDNISSSPSLSSGDRSVSAVSEKDEQAHIPYVTSVSVGTKQIDSKPSVYDGFCEVSSENDVAMTRHQLLEPRSSSPPQLPADAGELKPLNSPPREDRIAAIRLTAAQLKQRLEKEAFRLGLNLQTTGVGKTDDRLPSVSAAQTREYAVFKGTLPGVGSLREQAELNQKLDAKTSAATTIQAAYRGYSVRQGLNWKLPSGRTLRSTVREGLHPRTGFSGAMTSESSRYSTAWETMVPHEDRSGSLSDINTSFSEARSNARSAIMSSRSLMDDRSSSTRPPSLHDSGTRKHAPGTELCSSSPERKTDEALHSETFESPGHRTTSPYKEETVLCPSGSVDSGTLSPTLSEGELSRVSEVASGSPTHTSAQRSPRREQGTQRFASSYTAPVHPPPSVFMPSHEGGDRLSPGSLDSRLTAELNKLEYMEESVRQLTDVERTRAVSLAQQETVSLAQILKSKQLSHARDMENLRAKAREEALEAAKQLEEARRAAADAAAGAADTIARMRLEAAATVTESADRLVKVQSEAARTTTESAKQVEEARSSAARTLLEVAKQQTADTRGVAAEAASAAAEAAVRSAMSRYYEQHEQLQREREERLKSYRDTGRDDRSCDSYSQYSTSERTDRYSRSRPSRSGTDTMSRATGTKKSPCSQTYASDEVSRGSDRDKSASSIHTASNLPVDRASQSLSQGTSTPTDHARSATQPREETGSIPEEMEHSVADSVTSNVGLDVADDDSMDNFKRSSGHLERSPEDEEYTLNFEESVISSHTATDDEIDFRMILPSESHRRKSLGRTGRSSSVGSDLGTVSFSSAEIKRLKAANRAASYERRLLLMQQEEIARLRKNTKKIREKAASHHAGQSEDREEEVKREQPKAEIKRLKAANRAASYERRLLLMQQEEIARLRKNTKKIREKAASHHAGQSEDREEEVKREQPKSEAESNEIIEEFEDKPAGDQSTDQSISEEVKTASPSTAPSASVVDELPSYQSPGAGRSESHATSGDRGGSERKRSLSEGESDDGSAKDANSSAAKGSPTASDSTVMQKLKKLKHQSGEKYLTLREQKLMKRRKEAENLLEDKKKLLEWEKRLDQEEILVRNLLNEALKLESSRKIRRVSSLNSEDDEHRDRSPAGVSVSRTPSSRASGLIRSPQATESISESIKVSISRGHERSASESSMPEDIVVSARDKSHDSEKSRDSPIPEVEMKTHSQETSIPEDIPEEYVNDTFESFESTATPTHSTPLRKDSSIKKDTSPSRSRRSSNDGSKSEEEASMTGEKGTHLVEHALRSGHLSRVCSFKDVTHTTHFVVDKAVEMVISRTKAELTRPQTDAKTPGTNAVDLSSINTKSDSNDVSSSNDTASREIRYNLSRTTDSGGSRKLTPSDKAVSGAVKSGSSGGKSSSMADLDTSGRSEKKISTVPSLKQKDEKLGRTRTDESRSGHEPTSTIQRQSSEIDQVKAISEKRDTDEEIADEANTAADLSTSEQSVVQTESKASHSGQESRSSNRSLSGSRRQVSGSDREVSAKISDEAKSVESVSEIVSRTKSSRSESNVRDSEEKSKAKSSKGDISKRSSVIEARKPTASEVSRSSGLSRSVSTEKSRSSRTGYSSSFESVHSEGGKTEDDISEHISIEEDAKESEEKTSIPGYQPTEDRQSVKSTSRGEDQNATDISAEEEHSEIEELLSSAGKTASLSEDNRIASPSTGRSSGRENGLLIPEGKGDQRSSYSEDFEPSVLDETDRGKSESLKPQASYTEDFDASGSHDPEAKEESLPEKEEIEDVSVRSKEIGTIERSKGEERTKTPSVALDQITDEESIAEELDSREAFEEVNNKGYGFETQIPALKTVGEEARVSLGDKGKVNEGLQPRDDYPEGRVADRIAQDLSSMLLAESMNYVTSVLEKRRRTSEDFAKAEEESSGGAGRFAARAIEVEVDTEVASRSDEKRGFNKTSKGRGSFKNNEEVFRWLMEEEAPEADIISLSGGEEEVSGAESRTMEREGLLRKSGTSKEFDDQQRQRLRVEHPTFGEQSDSVMNKLSDALLMEAASQMIAIMKTKRAKFAQEHKEAQIANSTTISMEKARDEPHSGEQSPRSPPISNRFMAVQRFPEGVSKYLEENATPPGSPTDERRSSIDEKELAEKLDQLRRLHDHLDGARDKIAKDGDRLEFTVHTNKLIEFPSEDEDEEDEISMRSRASSFLFSVPHRPSEVRPIVTSSLSFYFERKRRGIPIETASPPSGIIGEDEADDDLEANSKRVYRRLIFDLSGNVLKELFSEEGPTNRPPWMKASARRKRRLHRGLKPLTLESDFAPVVEQEVLNLVGLGESRPSFDSVRRKTPLKAGKKDFVDAILIQELREEEPSWIDYDDDELAVKFQVADSILDSLLSETVMVVNAVQMRRQARQDAS